MLDSNLRFVDMSPEFCRLLGFEQTELIGRGVDCVIAGVNTQAYRDELRRVRTRTGVWVYRRKDGTGLQALYRMQVGPNRMIDWVITPIEPHEYS